jgi:LysM repeat protein
MIIRDLIIKEHRVLTEAQARAQLMEDPIYRQFRSVGQYIAERRMSQKEILQVFADAEAGMTDKATGANRTWMGRGKDTTMDFAGGVKDAVNSVLNSIQNSAPVAAVDVAYNEATDALAGLTGGQKGKVMQAIKSYRNLVKQYPKTAGFAKAALVAIAGLATGGAGLPAIAGLTYALDSAIKGDKLSSVIGKGGGAAALAAAGQAVSGAMNPGQADIGNVSGGQDIGGYNPDNVPGDLMTTPEPGWQSHADVNGMYAQEPGWPVSGSNGGAYTIQQGDQLGYIAQANGSTVEQIRAANPGIDFSKPLQPGMEIQLPTAGTPGQGSVWQGYQGNMYGDKPVPVKESWLPAVKLIRLPVNQLIDDKATIWSWALNESVGRKSKSVNLTTVGAYTIFENVDRYRKGIIKERKGVPGSTRPAYYRPDMPGAPVTPTKKPGVIGQGLNWLDKAAGKVGGALSNFGHQFTTNVTKEKLKMNWHLDGKPSDSDELSAWLVTQGVPQQVITSVYNKMGIPHTAPAAASAAPAPGAVIKGPAATTTTATAPVATPGAPAAANVAGYNDPKSANYVGRREVARRQAAQPAAAATAPTFAQQGGGYAKVNQPTAMKYSGVPMAKPAAVPTSLPADKTSEYFNALANKGADRDAVRNNPAMAQNESLSWSRNFNPGMTLFRQMKREQS